MSEDRTLAIARGTGSQAIADQLAREGIIENTTVFTWALRIYGREDDLKAGEYLFPARLSMREVMDILVDGKSILYGITIPEGLTSTEIVERLRQHETLSGEIRTIPEEGSLLPDTYKFVRGFSREQLIADMQRAQSRALREIWERRAQDIPIKSPRELVTLASIVEKETGRADERTRVAGVFINRLNLRLRLQSDPTIIYGITEGRGKLDRPILRSDIDKPTAYNTYTIDGLPPGPIANPGRAAMEAVANPSRTRDLYFVADGTGGHAFAETLEQHNRNVARWRAIERQQQLSPGTPAVTPPAPGSAPAPAVPPPGAPGQRPPAGRTGFVDPVANTPRDPLRNRDFDLNRPQTVPRVP